MGLIITKMSTRNGPSVKLQLGGCFASGGHSVDPGDLWRGEEEDEHRHGADYRPLGALSG